MKYQRQAFCNTNKMAQPSTHLEIFASGDASWCFFVCRGDGEGRSVCKGFEGVFRFRSAGICCWSASSFSPLQVTAKTISWGTFDYSPEVTSSIIAFATASRIRSDVVDRSGRPIARMLYGLLDSLDLPSDEIIEGPTPYPTPI